MTKLKKRPSDLYSIADLIAKFGGSNITSSVKRYIKEGLLTNWNTVGKRGIMVSEAEFWEAKSLYRLRNKFKK